MFNTVLIANRGERHCLRQRRKQNVEETAAPHPPGSPGDTPLWLEE